MWMAIESLNIAFTYRAVLEALNFSSVLEILLSLNLNENNNQQLETLTQNKKKKNQLLDTEWLL